MKVRLTLFLVLLCLLVQVRPAMAAWGSFVSLGSNTVNSDPSCAPLSGGKAICAATSFANNLLVNQFDGTAWAGWQKLAGAVTSGPSCAPDGNGKVICAARATNGGMVATVFDGAAWSPEAKLKAQLATGPSCSTLGGGRVLCAGRSASGGLTSSVFSGTAWSTFDNQTASSTTAPSCASDDAGRVVCAMLDTTSKVIVNRFNATAWDGFINIAGLATAGPTCSNFGVNSAVVCYGRGTDTSMFGSLFNGGAWNPAQWGSWSSIGGGFIASQNSCTSNGTKLVVCGAIATVDSALYADQFNGSSWLGFVKIGGTAIGNPSCTALNGGKVLCAITGVNNKVSSVVGP